MVGSPPTTINPFWDAASRLLAAGLSAFPAKRADKYPTGLSWGEFQQRRMEPAEIPRHFNGADAICIICGPVSGNLTVLDFDDGGSCFEKWRQEVAAVNPLLVDSLVVEKSPSGGYHAYVRSADCTGSTKLATKVVYVDGPGEFTIKGKKYVAKQNKTSGQWYVEVTLIETKANGGLILCDPSPGYCLVQGDFPAIPTITAQQLRLLLDCARAFDEKPAEPEPKPKPKTNYEKVNGAPEGITPWDDYNARGDFRDVLQRHGWRKVRDDVPGDDNERWRRPGKETGHSGTINGKRLFYCFSGNASPFDEGQAYSPFQVFMLLEHGGDQKAAGRALAALGYGRQDSSVDTSKILEQGQEPPQPTPHPAQEPIQPLTIRQLIERYPRMRAPNIHGLLREGETANIISAPKVGKSWLASDLALQGHRPAMAGVVRH